MHLVYTHILSLTHTHTHTHTHIYIYIYIYIPKSNRLSDDSLNIRIFKKHKHIYDNALKYSPYRQTLEYTPPKGKPKHRNRFNPPYNKYIASNIGRDFLNLVTKHFSNNSPLAKIFNRNNIKVSYSCTSNMSPVIKKRQKKNQIYQQYHTLHRPMEL